MKKAPAMPIRSSVSRKKVTMEDIAKHLGISKNSVSIALNNKSGLSDALRKRILEQAAQMNYGSMAAVLPEKRNLCIAVLVPEYLHNDNFFYSEILWAIETEAKARGCLSLNIGVTSEMESNDIPPELPDELDVVGLLAVGVMSDRYIQGLVALGLPILSVDIAYPYLPIGCIGSANLSGGYIATQALIEMGHKRIGFVGPIHTTLSIYERWCGYSLAMRNANLPIEAAHSILGNERKFQLFDTAEVLEPYVSNVEDQPSAWFCAGDRIAIAMVHLLLKRGIRVPEDVSIMGFDDLAVAEMLLPRLSTVHIDRKRMGHLAVQQLLRISKQPGAAPVNLSLPGTLVMRDSVKKLMP